MDRNNPKKKERKKEKKKKVKYINAYRQIPSPSCSTRAIQKSSSLNGQCWRILWKSPKHGPLAGKRASQKEQRTGPRTRTREELEKLESSDCPEISDRGNTSDFPGCLPSEQKVG